MIKYIGSKRILVPAIVQIAQMLPVASACDLFAGTTRVGQGLRQAGLAVTSNDRATYSEVLARAYICSQPEDRTRLPEILSHLMSLPGEHGYFTETFCLASRYFQAHNGRRIDAIRDEIERIDLTAVERALALTSLLEAADRVDSTVGLQMAYLKKWAPRSYNQLELRLPRVPTGPAGTALRLDANEVAPGLDVDLVYVDPPYNQHSYFSNYHVWETLIRWDGPPTYGVARKRIDCRTEKSDFNSKRRAGEALDALISALPCEWMIVSFSNEAYHRPSHVAGRLAELGHVAALELDFKRYVGAQIGIYNPGGAKVGSVGRLRNKEILFVVGPDPAVIAAIQALPVGAATTRLPLPVRV